MPDKPWTAPMPLPALVIRGGQLLRGREQAGRVLRDEVKVDGEDLGNECMRDSTASVPHI
ncbi:hypothetical protein [Streptomyces chartreusis]|uniref:Uncharacterized protein n=1 Tax=Streptomyces chartreusis TaxID=1969 RepID=A0A7H8T0V0_STRCX|nr:hypothetical protein [Streptomyces chartreusis]QKZ17051.1 hypothetical protein HUT05_06525 [Streptomyces chartreusis]